MARRDYRTPEAAAYRRLYKSTRWRALRLSVLQNSPLCVRCMARGKVVPATVVNHVKPHKGDLDLFYSRANLEAVCKPCHDGPIQSAERRGFSGEIGSDGWPVDPAHPSNE